MRYQIEGSAQRELRPTGTKKARPEPRFRKSIVWLAARVAYLARGSFALTARARLPMRPRR